MLKYWQQRRSARQALLERELERIVHVLRHMGVQRIVLFGSAAREKITVSSDLDLIVVLDSDLPFVKRLGLLYERIQPRVGLDLLAYTPQEFEALRERPFIRHALQEGRVLYETGSEGGGQTLATAGAARY